MYDIAIAASSTTARMENPKTSDIDLMILPRFTIHMAPASQLYTYRITAVTLLLLDPTIPTHAHTQSPFANAWILNAGTLVITYGIHVFVNLVC